MKIYNCPQRSPEWYECRKLKMTASHAQAIAAGGKGLETYIWELLAESISSAERESFTSKDMERGIELEELARSMYELETGRTVEEIGFVEHDQFSGCSPDGKIKDENGLIEIKCHNDVKHLRLLILGEKEIEIGYWWQMQMQMLIMEALFCDYCAYNPNFPNSLLIFRIYPDREAMEKIVLGLDTGKNLINEIKTKLSHLYKLT